MAFLRNSLILFVVLFSLSYSSKTETARAQGGINSWSLPKNLSETPTSSESPVIASDQYGNLHVFWSEDLFGPAHIELAPPNAGNAIMYRRYSNGNWSEPIDIVFAGNNVRADSPEALVDSNGTLHLTWIENQSIKYSSVPAWNSTQVKAWTPPVVLSEGWMLENRLIKVGDQILVIFSLVDGQLPGLYAISITAEAVSSPVLIWPGLGGYVPQYATAAVDGRGRIHVVWEVVQHPDPSAVEVRYARSEDGGATWSESRVVAKTTGEEDQVDDPAPWVAARGDAEIHIQWAQGVHTYRWHQFSTDGGNSWTLPAQIWEDFISQTRSFAVGTDSSGALYWADVLRYPNGGYLMRWTVKGWSFPEMFYEIQRDETVSTINRIHIHGVRMAFRFGNELHLVFKDQDRAEIWTMYRTVSANRIEPLPVPISTVTPTAPPVEVLSVSNTNIESRPDQPAVSNTWNENGLAENPGIIFVYGLVPVVILMFAFAIIRKRI